MKNKKDFNPFSGLRPFTSEDSNLFFGREAESDELILKLLKNRYITVLGTSGSGKSSLIYGGVLPKIMDLKRRESSTLRIISLKPGNDPLGNLAFALSNGLTEQEKSIDRERILTDLLSGPNGLSDVASQNLKGHDDNVLLIVDQFEDLFRYFSTAKSDVAGSPAKRFVEFLIASLNKQDLNLFIILALRSEYLGECSHYKGLTSFINDSNYLIPEMGTESLRKVIEGPVSLSGAKIEPELVEILLDDIKSQTDPLPVFQHALMRTWSCWLGQGNAGGPISKFEYSLAGTMDKAISIHADEIYDKLDQRGKEICAIMFKAITRKYPDSKGLRQPADIETIKSIAGCTTKELTEMIEKFRDFRNSFILPPEDVILHESTFIDIRHECLIHSWDRLKHWIDEEAASKEMYLRLSDASALYQQGKTGLFKPPDLITAIDWRNKYKPALLWAVQYNPAYERAMVYLRTSEKTYLEEEQNKIRVQKRKVKRTRLITSILGFVVLIAMGLIFFANVRKSAAEKQSLLAEKLRIQAEKEKMVADSFAVVAFRHNIISDSTTKAAVIDAAAAKEQIIVAEIQKSFAERNTEDALHQKNLAEQQNVSIQRLRMLSVGKSMSLKSLQMTDQKDLQILLAYQAYLFNSKNQGPENDADIFAGLYNASIRNGGTSLRSFKGHSGEIKSIAFLPGKNEFFTAGNDGQVLKWSLGQKDQTIQVIYTGSDIIDVLAVSPDATWLACGSSNSSIKMIPLKSNNIGYEMSGHKGNIKSLIFSYDGKFLYSAALDGKVLKWDIAARTSINVSTGSMEIASIDISPKGNYIAGLSTEGNVVVWNQERNSDNFRIETAGKNIKVVRFSPENNLLAIGDADGNVELWDIEHQKLLSKVKAHSDQVNDIQFNTLLKQMATSGNDKKLKIFNIKDPADLSEPPVMFADNEGFVLVMQFSPDGQMIISGESVSGNLLSRPSNVDYLARDMCSLVSRNMTPEEWNMYVGKDIPLEKTCQIKNYNIKIEPVKSLIK
jgi:WD40 repeat protein